MEDSVKVKGVTGIYRQKCQFFATIVVCLGSFGLGNVFGWTAPALPDLKAGQELGVLTSVESSWIASLALLGALLSGPISGFLINRIGRKILMLLMTLPFALGWCLLASAKNLAMMYAGRFLTGFAGGSFTVTIPVYVTEIAEDCIRGTLSSVMILTVASGILFTFVVGTFTSWSTLSLICATIPVLFFCFMLFIPETPRFLLTQGKVNEARNSLVWLRGNLDPREIDLAMVKIKRTCVVPKGHGCGSTGPDKPTMFIKQILISLSLFVFQQFSGINGITMYSVEIFQTAGSPLSPNMASIIIGIVQVIFVLISLIIVDKIGRKSLLFGADLVMAFSILILGTFYYFKKQNGGEVPDYLGWIPLVSLMAFIIAYSVGAGPLPWLLMAELLPPQAQGIGSSVITSCYWILAFLSALVFEDRFYQYWIFSAICFAGAIFTYFFVPETKGKTMEEIQRYFGSTSESNDENILNVNHSQFDEIGGRMVDLDNNVNVKAEKV